MPTHVQLTLGRRAGVKCKHVYCARARADARGGDRAGRGRLTATCGYHSAQDGKRWAVSQVSSPLAPSQTFVIEIVDMVQKSREMTILSTSIGARY